eukprot:1158426-Pelagomonas_calceolata.AAC.15
MQQHRYHPDASLQLHMCHPKHPKCKRTWVDMMGGTWGRHNGWCVGCYKKLGKMLCGALDDNNRPTSLPSYSRQ